MPIDNRVLPFLVPNLEDIISRNERILILGSSGWFGQTLIEMLSKSNSKLAMRGSIDGSRAVFDNKTIEQFQPTIVANFAFLTRNKLSMYSREQFIQINRLLIDRMHFAGQLDSVKSLLTVSSGASTDANAQDGMNSKEIYGALKKEEEKTALSCQTTNRSVVVLRAYSVSGPFVRNPNQYAFSSFIAQALLGEEIEMLATKPVFRRYISVGDLLAVGLVRAISGWSGVIESGGELLEIEELAQRVAKQLGAKLKTRNLISTEVADSYHSDDESWRHHLANSGLNALTLNEQIQVTADFLKTTQKSLM